MFQKVNVIHTVYILMTQLLNHERNRHDEDSLDVAQTHVDELIKVFSAMIPKEAPRVEY